MGDYGLWEVPFWWIKIWLPRCIESRSTRRVPTMHKGTYRQVSAPVSDEVRIGKPRGDDQKRGDVGNGADIGDSWG
mgnify:CR=1 FL=1